MSKNLIPLTISAPGFFGLNTQNAGSVLPPGWATRATNCVYDNVGRIAARNGHRYVNGTVITSTPTIRAAHEYIDGNGVRVNIIAADNKIYKEVSGTMTDVSTGIGTTMTLPTGDDWQFVNFNGWCIGFQAGHDPIVATSATAPAFIDSGGTQYQGVAGEAAFGRLWTVLNSTLYYSDLLINDFTGGSSGSFGLGKYWPSGMDEAVAVKEFNGMLLVFGKKSIIVYQNPDDITVMSIREGIKGLGCPYRDTIKTIGDDLVFMSATGLRSLRRALVEENLPLTDISQHIRSQLLNEIASETDVRVKAEYHEKEGFYLLSLPTTGKSYYFDRKFPNEDGTWRITDWDIAPTAMHYTFGGVLHLAVDDGYISKYNGYKDAILSNGTSGTAYTMDYIGVWNDFGQEVSALYKIPKTVSLVGAGSVSGDVVFKWAVNYESAFHTRTLAFSGALSPQYNNSEFVWGTARYAASGDFERVKAPLAGYGQVIKVGITASIFGDSFALQRLDILAKTGRLGL